MEKVETLRIMKDTRFVRVKWEVEELVELVSRRVGLIPATVRNLAILYGLPLVLSGKLPRNDLEFRDILEKVREIVGYEREEGEVR